jgi:autotransporter-associated beta strand protein
MSRISMRQTLAVLLACAAITVFAADASAGVFRWKVDADGNWTDAANWQLVSGPLGPGYPNSSNDSVVFSLAITAPRTVTIPSGVMITLASLQILEEANVTIAGAGSDVTQGRLIFSAGSDAPAIDIIGPGRSHRIDAPISLRGTLEVAVLQGNSALTLYHRIAQFDATPCGVTKTGNGVLRFQSSESNTYTTWRRRRSPGCR